MQQIEAFYFSNWIIYVTVKHFIVRTTGSTDFSNWIIYVTVKHLNYTTDFLKYFSNWIIYVTVKRNITGSGLQTYFSNWIIYVTVKRNGLWELSFLHFSNWIIYVTVYKTKTTNNIMSVFCFIKNQTRRFWFIKVIYKNAKQLFTVIRLSIHCVDNLGAIYFYYYIRLRNKKFSTHWVEISSNN